LRWCPPSQDASSLSILLSGEPLHVEIQQSLPFGTMAFHADRLSAFFLGVISLIAAAVSFYSLGYATEFIQEVITLLVFGVFSIFYLREELKWNYLLAFS
jgi:formate hydrogenlyase subunit 3/multisubunit Na+/H+ antiporter MnhD subunit